MRIKGYAQPKPGDKCYITKSFEMWSSSTLVEVAGYEQGEDILVYHKATNKKFIIPVSILVKKRTRS